MIMKIITDHKDSTLQVLGHVHDGFVGGNCAGTAGRQSFPFFLRKKKVALKSYYGDSLGSKLMTCMWGNKED